MTLMYAKYNLDTRRLLGYYEEDVGDCLPLTIDEWQAALAINANTVVDGTLQTIEYEEVLTPEEQRRQYKRIRDRALKAITHDFGDGRIVQVRPEDVGNFQIAIASNVPIEWVMENNTVEDLTVAELQAALASGISQGKSIYDDYMQSIKLLYIEE